MMVGGVQYIITKKYFKQKMKLTVEELRVRSLRHLTRSQLYKHDPSAYMSAKRQGLLDNLYPNPGAPQASLGFEEIMVRAIKFKNRTEFSRHDNAAFKSARRQGLLDNLFPRKIKQRRETKPHRKYSIDILKALHPSLSGPGELQRIDNNAYSWLQRNRLLCEMFPNHVAPRKMTKEFALTLCLKYTSRSHLQAVDPSLYTYMRKHNLLLTVFPESKRHARNDAVYMTGMVGQFYNGLPVYKFGVTSSHLGLARIKSQNLNARAKHEVVIPPTAVIGSATDIEVFALGLGCNPKFVGFDGCTEYRAYSDGDLSQIKMMVELCSKEKQQ